MSANIISGAQHLMNQCYQAAVSEFTTFINNASESREKLQGLIYRATAHTYSKNYEEALKDLDAAGDLKESELNFEYFYKKGIALFGSENFQAADEVFKKALTLAEHQEQRDKLVIWTNKVEIELEEKGLVTPKSSGGINVTAIKVTHHWTQSLTHLTLTLDSNIELSKDDVLVTVDKKLVKLVYKSSNHTIFELHLSNSIIPAETTWEFQGRKIIFELKKEVANFNWVNIEREKAALINPDRPSYPSSAKVKRDWDNLERDINREIEEDERKDPNAGMMLLFKDIFAKADENTRRAMMKSYQTSGGTVLSTNWNEVQDKDYEGKDKPDAPKGQEWKKYD
jgi:tetratricopeptide (TPR) repeat protein